MIAHFWSAPCCRRIPPEAIEIMKRPDGSPWQLGSGGFGTVFKARPCSQNKLPAEGCRPGVCLFAAWRTVRPWLRAAALLTTLLPAHIASGYAQRRDACCSEGPGSGECCTGRARWLGACLAARPRLCLLHHHVHSEREFAHFMRGLQTSPFALHAMPLPRPPVLCAACGERSQDDG